MRKTLLTALLVAVSLSAAPPVRAQESLLDRIRTGSSRMAELQPAWIAPLIQSDPRLMQGARLSVSRATVPGAQVFSYGNNHGVSLVAGTRFQFEADPPSFFRNHCSALPDGWGNAAAQVKFRIASGNAAHGNFAVAAILAHGFASGARENGALTGVNLPKLAAGKAFGRFGVQSTLGGLLPTGKIERQGRAIEWNAAGQLHTSAQTWFDVENNTAFLIDGPHNGEIQNFITPAAFVILKRKSWSPSHRVAILDGGMQMATSRFHCQDHNLITELRILF